MYTQAQEALIKAEMDANGYDREEAIQVLAARNWKAENSKSGGFSWDFLGNVATQLPGLVSQFDRKGRETELAIAQANAAAAQANASSVPQKSGLLSSNTTIYIVAGVIVLLLIFLFFFKKQPAS